MSTTGVRHSRRRKQQAVLLRTRGWSVKRIAKHLRIAVSTASLWVRHVPVTDKQRARLLAFNGVVRGQAAHERAVERLQRWQQEARALWVNWRNDPFFMLGVGIYWGEGTKSYRRLSVANSDPDLIRAWVKWCEQYIPDGSLHVTVTLPQGADAKAARRHWRKITGLELIDVYWNRPEPRLPSPRRNRVLPHGTAHVRLCRGSTEWHAKMLEWLRLLADV